MTKTLAANQYAILSMSSNSDNGGLNKSTAEHFKEPEVDKEVITCVFWVLQR